LRGRLTFTALHREALVYAQHAHEAREEQTRGDEQHRAQPHLRRDEHLARAHGLAPIRRRAPALAPQNRRRIRAAKAKRGQHAEREAGGKRDA
jgi:hypothetical protein